MGKGRKGVRGSGKKSDPGTLSNDDIKAKNAPASTPGRMIGRVTRRKVYQADAPRLAELSIQFGSSSASAATVVRITKGTQTTVCPITKVSGETGMPSSVNHISAARPKARPGKTSGDMNIASRTRAAALPDRAIASAAGTPASTVSAVVENATSGLFLAANCNCESAARAGDRC